MISYPVQLMLSSYLQCHTSTLILMSRNVSTLESDQVQKVHTWLKPKKKKKENHEWGSYRVLFISSGGCVIYDGEN